MSHPQPNGSERRDAGNRREFSRVKLSLLGRCLFSDGREVPVELEDMSPGGAALCCSRPPGIGTGVVAYIDHIGRIEGVVTRSAGSRFAMTIEASPRKQEKLADTLTWLANRAILNLPETRRDLRRAPTDEDTTLILPDGTRTTCRIMDMSATGAAIATSHRPRIGLSVRLGRVGSRVIRHFEDGIAVEFTQILMAEQADKATTKEWS